MGHPLEPLERADRTLARLRWKALASLGIVVVAMLFVIRQDFAARAAVDHWRDKVSEVETKRRDEGWALDVLLELASPETAAIPADESGWNPRMLELLRQLPDADTPERQAQYPCTHAVLAKMLEVRQDDNFAFTAEGRKKVIETIRRCRDGSL